MFKTFVGFVGHGLVVRKTQRHMNNWSEEATIKKGR